MGLSLASSQSVRHSIYHYFYDKALAPSFGSIGFRYCETVGLVFNWCGFIMSPVTFSRFCIMMQERSSLHCGKSCIGEESYQVVSCCPIEHTASSSSSTSTKTATSNKRMLQRQAKSLGQYDEFKAAALTTDLSLVQERLAVLETNELACHDQPPELPPRDYFSYQEEML